MWNMESDVEDAFRKKVIIGSAAIVVLGILGAIYYYKYYGQPPAAPKPAEPPKVVAPQQATEPAVHNPVPANPGGESKPLPELNASDPDVRAALSGLFGSKAIEQFLVPEHIVRHIVATVDNLPRKKVAVELRPVKPTPGTTVTAAQADSVVLGAGNYERYAPFIKIVQATDPKALSTVYFQLYPLFQQAYENLGYPGQYFNDRLIEVIDDLLQAPEVQGPIALRQPRVFFEYADPKLEGRSAGQKLLIRMGPANAAIIKAKLRELRQAVATRPDEPVNH